MGAEVRAERQAALDESWPIERYESAADRDRRRAEEHAQEQDRVLQSAKRLLDCISEESDSDDEGSPRQRLRWGGA